MPETEDIQNSLTKKIGPLPGYMWVLVAVVGYIGYRWYKSRQGAAIPVGYGLDTGTMFGTNPSPIGGPPSGTAGTTPQGTSPVTTNAQWGREVTIQLVGLGDDPTLVSNAISDYLNGNPLPAAEQAIINKAVQMLGPPPEGVLPVKPAPAPAPAPAPQTKNYYTIQPGDTWKGLSQRFYGTDQWWQILYNVNQYATDWWAKRYGNPRGTLNPKVGSGEVTFPGEPIWVPRTMPYSLI